MLSREKQLKIYIAKYQKELKGLEDTRKKRRIAKEKAVELADWLYQHRKQQGLTNSGLAQVIGITKKSIERAVSVGFLSKKNVIKVMEYKNGR